ncbi:Transcription elongation protein NusA [[Clostridium] cellulosi]|uniref:Transcription termination/antitermination protein NusA n=1 Tax=[Clostridium] cellulosi TaxID=29343 RepID=A0A078KRM2_9FIRM|nr:Transcription elongation protein NusA [[Clostridium] cellulosi]
MNAEFFDALETLEKEKGIPKGYLAEKIANALNIAVKHNYKTGDNTVVEIDPEKRVLKVALRKKVVEEVQDPQSEILLEEARNIDRKAEVGGEVEIELDTHDFGRIAAQTAKHVIRQGIREVEREVIANEVMSRQHELVTGVIQRIDKNTQTAYIEIGRTEAIMPPNEQLPGEALHEGDHIKVYIAEVKTTEKGTRTIVSRTHPGVIRRLFELEVPEIFDGTVEIMGIAREPGSRTKVAVMSKNPDVDAIGACIGPKGGRVNNISKELAGEKIDLILYSDEITKYIAAALAPAKVISVTANREERRSRVIVPDDQLSLAIGNKGQNVRLAAKLTGWRIDIKPESDMQMFSENKEIPKTAMAAAFEAAVSEKKNEESENQYESELI